MKIFGKEIDNKKVWWLAGIVAILGAVVAYFVFWGNDDETASTPLAPEKIEKAKAKAISEFDGDWSKSNDEFPLKYGSYGTRVEILQSYLKNVQKLNIGSSGIDGKLGKDTLHALLAWSKRDNISEAYWNKTGLNTYKPN